MIQKLVFIVPTTSAHSSFESLCKVFDGHIDAFLRKIALALIREDLPWEGINNTLKNFTNILNILWLLVVDTINTYVWSTLKCFL